MSIEVWGAERNGTEDFEFPILPTYGMSRYVDISFVCIHAEMLSPEGSAVTSDSRYSNRSGDKKDSQKTALNRRVWLKTVAVLIRHGGVQSLLSCAYCDCSAVKQTIIHLLCGNRQGVPGIRSGGLLQAVPSCIWWCRPFLRTARMSLSTSRSSKLLWSTAVSLKTAPEDRQRSSSSSGWRALP